ncbi:MAG: rhamnose/proton symporter RhaT [Calditrichaeota bacterium]|nr:MAG: rhamnose/proton symporter RhaT [Calditrichota bacterium]
MNPFALSLALILLAGLFQGSFGLGMKKFAPLSWESFWALFTIIGMMIIPLIWGSKVVPDLGAAIAAVPPSALIASLFFGACWGVGSIMFGRAITYIGMSIAYGISMGLAAAVGSLVPLFNIPDIFSHPSTPFILLGVAVMVGGVAVITVAAVRRDRSLQKNGANIVGVQKGRLFRIGLLFAILNGVFSAFLNIGFVKAAPAAQAAVEQGALPRNASLAAWIVVLFGGFLINLSYSFYLMIKNNSFKTYWAKGVGRCYLAVLLTAVLWFAALGLYGQGAAIMGELGPVIGWTMFLALALIVSTFWGIISGEWKGVNKPKWILLIGDALLILSWIILSLANSTRV